MRKELVDLIHEVMDQHELSRDFYHRLALRVTHPDTRETFEYLAKEAEENKTRLHQCLTPEGCPVVPPVREALAAQKALSWLLGDYVFVDGQQRPMHRELFRMKVWEPVLKRL